MSSRLVQLDFTYIFSFRNFIGKATAKQLIITFYFKKSLRDIFVFIQSSRNHRIASELRYMVLKVCMVIVIIIFTLGKYLLLLFERFIQALTRNQKKNPENLTTSHFSNTAVPSQTLF